MPKQYFQSLPTIQYDVTNSGTELLAINILKRIKVRAETISDGAIFYNYQYQEGDTPEIIADKYYGSSQYHWVVMMMNNAAHYVYDFPLSSVNFSNFIKDKYGSIERAFGVEKIISNDSLYATAGIFPEWYSSEQTKFNNSSIESGTIPEGNTTAIFVESSIGVDPFSTIGSGDIVRVFVPSSWYDPTTNNFSKIAYTQPAKILSKSIRINTTNPATKRDYYLNTNMNSNTYDEFSWIIDDPSSNTVGEVVSVITGIHHFEMDVYDSTGQNQLANNVIISQNQYVNNSIGTTPFNSKRIVNNHDFEVNENERKRTIFLLKREFLGQFIDEFETISKSLV